MHVTVSDSHLPFANSVAAMAMSSDNLLSDLLQSCASITKKALSLQTLKTFEDLDVAISHEYEIAKWLDRQVLDYTYNCNGAFEEEAAAAAAEMLGQEHVVVSKSKKTQQTTTSSDLLEKTWNQNLYHLLVERIKMASSARVALLPVDGGTLATLLREGLLSRDDLADQVTRLQNQVAEMQTELQTITGQCRTLQGENRHLWTELRAVLDGKTAIHHEDDKLVERNWVLKRVLADLIVGTDSLYMDERIADTFLKLEH